VQTSGPFRLTLQDGHPGFGEGRSAAFDMDGNPVAEVIVQRHAVQRTSRPAALRAILGLVLGAGMRGNPDCVAAMG
jgi:hypothetical protein